MVVSSHVLLNDQQPWHCSLLTTKRKKKEKSYELNQIQPAVKHQMQNQIGIPPIYIRSCEMYTVMRHE